MAKDRRLNKTRSNTKIHLADNSTSRIFFDMSDLYLEFLETMARDKCSGTIHSSKGIHLAGKCTNKTALLDFLDFHLLKVMGKYSSKIHSNT